GDVAYLSNQTGAPVDESDHLDPFLVGHYHHAAAYPVGFGDGEQDVLDHEQLVRAAASAGLCPHKAMMHLGSSASVLLGNYNHLVHPGTRHMTRGEMGILDEDTFLVVDEAHGLEEKARDYLSETVPFASFDIAAGDIEAARLLLTEGRLRKGEDAPDPNDNLRDRARQAVRGPVADGQRQRDIDTVVERLTEAEAFVRHARGAVSDAIEDGIDADTGRRGDFSPEWRDDWPARNKDALAADLSEKEVPLRDPGTPEQDSVRDALAALPADETDIWTLLSRVEQDVATALDAHPRDRDYRFGSVARLLDAWRTADDARHFPLVTLTPGGRNNPPAPWQAGYEAEVELFDCLPADALADVFEELGGGVVMSATLEPLDIYTEVVGLDAFAEETGRPVETATFGLNFPEENRESLAVGLTKYTYKNRGAPVRDSGDMTPTRRRYATAIRKVARSPGNVLLAMPSYREAKWAADVLDGDSRLGKPVHVDQSSSAAETDAMLDKFTAGPASVVVTSARGTITEGVDYPDDDLHTAAVVGVPLVGQSPRMEAVVTAYGDKFGNGYEYAKTIPAVRKARQAFGRVIRSGADVGTRILIDERYASDGWDSVNSHLSPQEQTGFQAVSPDMLDLAIEGFWSEHGVE
ncbi:hypothetical protein DMJ13_27440, partial [halophilic archaeon]